MVDGVVEGVLLDSGQRAHPVVDASGRWVFDEGDQYPGAHPTVSAEGEWVSDDRDPEAGGLDRVVVSAPGGVREPWEYRPPSSGSESYFGAPGDLWAGMVDWWFSHDIPTEGLPSGGGLMVGPLEMAKLGNFLKDALLPLMAGDIGLAGVGGLGPFDPLPLPFGKVIGEGVKGAKAGVRAVRGAVRGGDEAVEAAARGTWSVDYPEAELVPIEFFDDMPSVNMEVERAGDVDTDLFSYKTTSEDLERLGSLAERADLGPGEFRVFATEVLGGADELELENFGALMADMETRGLDNPLVVDFDPDTGGVILGEGNHRLAAARELGWDVVPVSVRRSSVAAELALDTEKLLPPLEQLGDLPQTISPSQVGMPTAGGVARETGESTARTVDDPELANALSQRVISFSLHGGENERIIRAALEQAPFNKATLYKGATKYDYADQIKSGRVTFENSTSTSLDESVARQFAAEGERPLTTPEYRRWATGEVPARIDPYAPLDKPVLFEIPPDQTRSLDVTARVKEARDAELAQKGIFPTPIDDTGRGGYSVGHGGLGPSPVDEYLDYTIGSEGQMEHLIAGSFKVDEIVDEGTFLRVRLVREETASGVARETGGKPAAPTSAVDDLPVPEEYLGDLRALHEKGTGELIIANPTVGDLVAKADELEGEFWAKIEPGFESSAENIYVSVKGGGPQSIFRELASSHVSGIPIPNIVSDKWTPGLPKQLYDLRAWDAPTHPGLFERQQRLANEAGDDLWEAYVDDFLTRYPDQDPIIVLSQEVKAHGPPGPTGGIITSPIPAWSHLDAIGQSVQEWLDGYALRKTARTIMEGGK